MAVSPTAAPARVLTAFDCDQTLPFTEIVQPPAYVQSAASRVPAAAAAAWPEAARNAPRNATSRELHDTMRGSAGGDTPSPNAIQLRYDTIAS